MARVLQARDVRTGDLLAEGYGTVTDTWRTANGLVVIETTGHDLPRLAPEEPVIVQREES